MVRKDHFNSIDELSAKILEEIGRDPRQSLRKISKKVGAAPSTVKERLDKFERTGIIKGYSVIVDNERLGYMNAIMQVNISQGKLLGVEKKIASIPQVLKVYDVSGEVDAIVIARCKDKTELSNLAKRISSMSYVEKTITHIIFNEIK